MSVRPVATAGAAPCLLLLAALVAVAVLGRVPAAGVGGRAAALRLKAAELRREASVLRREARRLSSPDTFAASAKAERAAAKRDAAADALGREAAAAAAQAATAPLPRWAQAASAAVVAVWWSAALGGRSPAAAAAAVLPGTAAWPVQRWLALSLDVAAFGPLPKGAALLSAVAWVALCLRAANALANALVGLTA